MENSRCNKRAAVGSPCRIGCFTQPLPISPVTRLVNVSAFDQRDVISQQLQRNRIEDRGDGLFHMRHLNDVHVIAVEAGFTVGEDV